MVILSLLAYGVWKQKKNNEAEASEEVTKSEIVDIKNDTVKFDSREDTTKKEDGELDTTLESPGSGGKEDGELDTTFDNTPTTIGKSSLKFSIKALATKSPAPTLVPYIDDPPDVQLENAKNPLKRKNSDSDNSDNAKKMILDTNGSKVSTDTLIQETEDYDVIEYDVSDTDMGFGLETPKKGEQFEVTNPHLVSSTPSTISSPVNTPVQNALKWNSLSNEPLTRSPQGRKSQPRDTWLERHGGTSVNYSPPPQPYSPYRSIAPRPHGGAGFWDIQARGGRTMMRGGPPRGGPMSGGAPRGGPMGGGAPRGGPMGGGAPRGGGAMGGYRWNCPEGIVPRGRGRGRGRGYY